MHSSIKKTKEEIDEQLRRGALFVEKHPYSMFGDDNAKGLRIVENVLNKAKEGFSIIMLESHIGMIDDEGEYMTASDACVRRR